MKYLSWILATLFTLSTWLVILPFAVLALPYLWITHKVKVDSKGYTTILSFFTSLKGIPHW